MGLRGLAFSRLGIDVAVYCFSVLLGWVPWVDCFDLMVIGGLQILDSWGFGLLVVWAAAFVGACCLVR